jgi:hypothetical protein
MQLFSHKRKRLLPSRALLMCVGILAGLLTVTGCMPKDSVRLVYAPAASAVLPAPTAPRIAVVLFEDQRGKADIGAKKDGKAFVPGSQVAEWISRSLADELSRKGPQVSYAPSIQLAQSAQPDFLVTGAVEEVWIKETNLASYSATVRINIRLATRNGVIFNQTLSSTQEKTGVPGARLVESVLTETVREVLSSAAAKIAEAAK